MFVNTKVDKDELERKLQRELLVLLVLTSCIANMVGFLSNLFLFGMSLPTIVCGVCEVVVIICGVIGIGFGRQKIATVVMVIVITMIEFPFLFYVYGANMGVYFALGIVAIAIYFPRPYHMVMLILNILVDVGVIVLSFLYPCHLETMTKESNFATMICSYVIVAVAIVVMISTLIRQYVLQRNQLFSISQQLEYSACHDALTKVYNRGYLLDTLNKWMGEKQSFVIALIDIDDFKQINDTYGHLYGDQVLIALGRIMEQTIGKRGICSRYGGEEFMVLFENTTQKGALELLDKMKEELSTFSMETKQISITFSGGMAKYSMGKKIDELFKVADNKLYEAKSSGKNQVIV